MIFDTFELITFVMALLGFIILTINSRKLKNKKLKFAFILAFLFILLNRIFTNVEALFFRDFFNLIEHSCKILAALSFAYAGFLGGNR